MQNFRLYPKPADSVWSFNETCYRLTQMCLEAGDLESGWWNL